MGFREDRGCQNLVDYLGGEEETIFITDRELISSQAVDHMLELSDAEVIESYESDGRKRLEGEHVAIWLYPGEDLESVDLEKLEFSVDECLVPEWHRRARAELGGRICAKVDEGWPIVIEAAFGPNMPGPDGWTLQLTIIDRFRADVVAAFESITGSRRNDFAEGQY